MSNIPILNLPVAISLTGTEYTPVVQGGTTKRAAVALFNLTGDEPSSPQDANTVFAGPTSGSPDYPSFRALVAADLPAQSAVPTGTTAGYLLQTNGLLSTPTWEGFLQAGSGATTLTWRTKNRQIVNVDDFGAVGDNSTDDSAAFIAALTAASTVYCTQGKIYRIKDVTVSGKRSAPRKARSICAVTGQQQTTAHISTIHRDREQHGQL